MDDAFAPSIVWGFTAAAETSGRVLVEVTDFLLRDAHGVIPRLRPATYRLERSRSAVYMPRTKAFPRNSEMEVTLTFVTDAPGQSPGQPGGRIQDVAASAEAVTLRQHHSLIELPDGDYKDGFRVEVMPDGADMLDIRYNVIQWVHRSTRGWSYGASVTDPRTGEIIKGHVTLGPLSRLACQHFPRRHPARRSDRWTSGGSATATWTKCLSSDGSSLSAPALGLQRRPRRLDG